MIILLQIDKQLASGEYFLNKEQKRAKQQKEKDEKHADAAKRREERRQQAFVPPEEPGSSKPKKPDVVDLEAIKAKVKKAQQGAKMFSKKTK